MYQTHFHLNSRPFAAAPNPEHYFPSSSAERARESLVQSVERAAGIAMLIGPVGTGKTLLCQLVANHFQGDVPVCVLSGARLCNRETLLQSILHHLGLPYRNLREGELRLSLTDYISGRSCPDGMLLIVDEADRLSLELLEELRVITNLVQQGLSRVRLVLAGGPRLEERVGHPKLESLNQRVVCRLYLDNFTGEETCDYIRARITACGADSRSLFTDEALKAVYQATSGVPRLVNQVSDHALILGAVNAHDQLDRQSIEEAWGDLQQLPVPQRAHESEDTATDDIVEFGALDEEELSGLVPDFDPTRQIDVIESQMTEFHADEDHSHEEPSRELEFAADEHTQADEHTHETQTENEFEDSETPGPCSHHNSDEETDSQLELAEDQRMELTIDQAANPFDEPFADEEIVIQMFASPVKVAGRHHHQVSSAYSSDLARRLSNTQPPLRMHVEDAEDAEEEVEVSAYQPLSQYLAAESEPEVIVEINEPANDESIWEHAVEHSVADRDAGHESLEDEPALIEGAGENEIIIRFDQGRFDPQDDPVMPEFGVEFGTSDVGFVVEDVVPAMPIDGVYSEVVIEDSVSPSSYSEPLERDESIPAATIEQRKPKAFRRLFSNMRRA